LIEDLTQRVEYEHHLKTKSAPKCAIRDPAGTRTQDPYIKSVLLYQLSYGIDKNQPKSSGFFGSAKIRQKALIANFLWNIFPP
jgi:hypothetical protein